MDTLGKTEALDKHVKSAPVFKLLRNGLWTKGTRTSGCFAWYSRDARDAGGSLVDRKHERVRRRTTGKCPVTGQGVVYAVTGDQSTDSHLNVDVDVTSQPYFFWLEACANALASRAQETW